MLKGFISGCVEGFIEKFKNDPEYALCFTDDSKNELSEFGVLCVTFASINATLSAIDMIPKVFAQVWDSLSEKDKNA